MSQPFVRVTKIDREVAESEFGGACQRIFPLAVVDDTFGSMVCWLDPHSETELDQHNQRELVIVTAGNGLLRSGAAAESVAPGDVVLIERGHPHTMESGEVTVEWLSVFWPRIEA